MCFLCFHLILLSFEAFPVLPLIPSTFPPTLMCRLCTLIGRRAEPCLWTNLPAGVARTGQFLPSPRLVRTIFVQRIDVLARAQEPSV